MPSINLRLSEKEHDALRKWAFDSRRSLQKEIVWRLFSEPALTERALGSERAEVMPRQTEPRSVSADAQPRDIPARTVEFPGERVRGGPDPKPGQKR